MLTGGIYSAGHTRHFLQSAAAVQGVVVETVWSEDRTSNRGVSRDNDPRIRIVVGDVDVLPGMGVLFTGPATGLVLWTRAHYRKIAWLHQNGQRIQAEFTGVELNTSLKCQRIPTICAVGGNFVSAEASEPKPKKGGVVR